MNYRLSNPSSVIRQSVALTNLTEGEHDFSVTASYVVDFSSRNVTQLKGAPKPIHVTIDAEPEPQQIKPFPTSLVIAPQEYQLSLLLQVCGSTSRNAKAQWFISVEAII